LEYHSTWAGLGLRCLIIIFILSFTFFGKNNNILQLDTILNNEANRDIRKVRKRQHQYPEFGHTLGEIFLNLQKMYIRIEGGDETQKTINFKVRKRQHQYPEFGHTQGENFKNLQKCTLDLKAGMKLRKPSISKSGKNSTSTLSLVIHRVRFLKNLQNYALELMAGMKLRNPVFLPS
jgi:hypothetical protein